MVHRVLSGSFPAPKNSSPPGKARKPDPLFVVEQVREQLDQKSRKPFEQFLALLLEKHPTPENIQAFANKNPDKWSQAVSIFSKLTGYNDTLEVNHNIYATVTHMSDMDLEHQLRAINHKIGDSHLVDPNVIETPYKRVNDESVALRRISKK